MKLNTLFNLPGAKKTKKRVGRGIGSGKGKTCSRGVKGQKSRSGVAIKIEGGQMPLIKRLPKRGFSCSKSINYTEISILELQKLIDNKHITAENKINKDLLVSIGYIKNSKVPVKLLGGVANISYQLTVNVDACSKSAKSVIEKAGGSIV